MKPIVIAALAACVVMPVTAMAQVVQPQRSPSGSTAGAAPSGVVPETGPYPLPQRSTASSVDPGYALGGEQNSGAVDPGYSLSGSAPQGAAGTSGATTR